MTFTYTDTLGNVLDFESLKEKRDAYHELAEDHWSYQCSELSPCEYCIAIIAANKEAA